MSKTAKTSRELNQALKTLGKDKPGPRVFGNVEPPTVKKQAVGDLYRSVARGPLIDFLVKMQIPIPPDLPSIREDQQFPIDITPISDEHLRQLMSFWTAQFARTNALLSMARATRKRLERYADRETKRQFRLEAPAGSPRATFVDKVWGSVYNHVHIRKIQAKLDKAIEIENVLEGYTTIFKSYYETCSREMTWRITERQTMR